MHDSVQTNLCNKLALEHVVPVRDWQLTCKDCCLSVISVIYDLLKIVLQLPFQPDHAKVVYDKQVGIIGRVIQNQSLCHTYQ